MLPEEYRHHEPLGVEIRFDHIECGDTRQRLYVTRTSKGWKHHCHNCAPRMSGFTFGDTNLSPVDTAREVKKLTENQVVRPSEIELPADFSSEIPPRGLAWLTRYGISAEEVTRFGLGYSRGMDRLILPVYQKDQLVFWQGRALGTITKENPKYINVRAGGRDVYFERDSTNRLLCCIVEDILSAIKVGRHTHTIALLGSYISDSLIRNLFKAETVRIWLDADKYTTALRYSTRISALAGIISQVIYTPNDPKEYSDEQIHEILYPPITHADVSSGCS